VCYSSNDKFLPYNHTQKPATTVRLFDRSEYYTLHGDDAELAAKCVFKSLTHIKTMSPQPDGDELKYVVLSKTNFENFVRELLLVKNYRVEVYTNKKAGKTSAEFTLEFKGSPGNLMQFEELLFSNNDMVESTTIIALQLKVENQQRVSIYMIISMTEVNVFFIFYHPLECWCGVC
jgi:DNA mismatch repair protein MSH2